MSAALLTISILTFGLYSCSQRYKEYYFSDIGMSVKLPSHFIIQDSFPKPSYFDANHNRITDSAEIKVIESDFWKALLIVKYPDEKNIMSFNLALESSKTGDFKQYYDFSKTMQHLMYSEQIPSYDSSSKIFNKGTVSIHKFLTSSTKSNPKTYSGFYLADLKNYFLFVKVDYVDKSVGEEFEKVLLSSNFK